MSRSVIPPRLGLGIGVAFSVAPIIGWLGHLPRWIFSDASLRGLMGRITRLAFADTASGRWWRGRKISFMSRSVIPPVIGLGIGVAFSVAPVIGWLGHLPRWIFSDASLRRLMRRITGLAFAYAATGRWWRGRKISFMSRSVIPPVIGLGIGVAFGMPLRTGATVRRGGGAAGQGAFVGRVHIATVVRVGILMALGMAFGGRLRRRVVGQLAFMRRRVILTMGRIGIRMPFGQARMLVLGGDYRTHILQIAIAGPLGGAVGLTCILGLRRRLFNRHYLSP
jgi:hypothetical protein